MAGKYEGLPPFDESTIGGPDDVIDLGPVELSDDDLDLGSMHYPGAPHGPLPDGRLTGGFEYKDGVWSITIQELRDDTK